MSGTVAGGQKACRTNIERHGRDFYRKMGSLGGKACVPKGFGKSHNRAKTAGSIGGQHSKRGYKFIEEVDGVRIYKNKTTGKIEVFVIK